MSTPHTCIFTLLEDRVRKEIGAPPVPQFLDGMKLNDVALWRDAYYDQLKQSPEALEAHREAIETFYRHVQLNSSKTSQEGLNDKES